MVLVTSPSLIYYIFNTGTLEEKNTCSESSFCGSCCSGQKKPDSRGHHSEALSNLGAGNLEGVGNGKGLRKGRSVYKQPETEVDGSCHSWEGSK